MPRAAETADKDLPLAVLLLSPRPSPGDAGFLSRGPLAASGTALTCSWSEAGVRSSSRCLSSAVYQRSHLSSISYHPSSPVAQSLIRSWDFQAPPLIPLPCIDNPASPLHTRTLAHALQPNGLGLLFFAQHHCRNSSSSRTRQDPGVCLLTASLPPVFCLCFCPNTRHQDTTLAATTMSRPPTSTSASSARRHSALGHGGGAADDDLARMGYKAELPRSLSMLSVLGLSFAIMAVPYGLSTTFLYSLANGQSVTVLWGWVMLSLISVCIAASLAEICSVFPTAGGVYYWAALLSTPEWAPIASWITGTYTHSLVARLFHPTLWKPLQDSLVLPCGM